MSVEAFFFWYGVFNAATILIEFMLGLVAFAASPAKRLCDPYVSDGACEGWSVGAQVGPKAIGTLKTYTAAGTDDPEIMTPSTS